MKKLFLIHFIFILLLSLNPADAKAQALLPDIVTMYKAEVIEILNTSTTTSVVSDTPVIVQDLKVKILDKEKIGERVELKNDTPNLLKVGEKFYLKDVFDQGSEIHYYTVSDPYRLDILLYLSVLFLILLFIFGGKQGLRGLVSFIASVILIFYFLIPKLLTGEDVLFISIASISLMIIVGSYLTHGINKMTTSAMLGMIITVSICGILTYLATHFGHFTGFGSEEAVYLNFNTFGKIDMLNLLFSSILIGLLGVLYDIAIGQSVAVEELFLSSNMSKREIFFRASRIGKEHIGALINTLAIAYLGAALPLLLFVTTYYSNDILFLLNAENFATEIIRILIGSIGLIIAVPVTTLISVYLLCNPKRKENSKSFAKDYLKFLNSGIHKHEIVKLMPCSSFTLGGAFFI